MRVWKIAIFLVVLLGSCAAILVAGGDASPSSAPAGRETATAPPSETATVVERDMITTEDWDGVLGYGTEIELAGQGTGMLTLLPPPGSQFTRGDALWEVDGEPGPRLFYGSRPMWRELRRGVPDGADVQQVEENLVALGFAPEGMVVDESFDADTRAAVRAWQEAIGVSVTGVVSPADVVVAPGEVRVARHLASTGQSADRPVLAVTGTDHIVTLQVRVTDVERFATAGVVTVEMPGGARLDGVVARVADTATRSNDGSASVEVVVTLAETTVAWDATPVKVLLTRVVASNVMVVPFRALLALSEGGYAVERMTEEGTELVGVELGASGDGVVEVRPLDGAELAVGDRVVVAP